MATGRLGVLSLPEPQGLGDWQTDLLQEQCVLNLSQNKKRKFILLVGTSLKL